MSAPDYVNAQKDLKAAIKRIYRRYGFTNAHGMEFIVTLSAVQSSILAEMVGSDRIATPEGIEQLVDIAKDQLTVLLRQDLTERAAREAAASRH